MLPAAGVHEVIIESADHVDRISALAVSDVRGFLEAYAARLRFWRDRGLKYGLVFKNHGASAGASLAHVHSQLIALPFVPPAVEAELERSNRVYTQRGGCPYCRLIADERIAGERVVFEASGFMAFCPFASLQPYEVWLMPTEHTPSFEYALPEEFDRLAVVVLDVVRRIESLMPKVAYNMWLRTEPWQSGGDAGFHWRMEFLPRITALAGLELASGLFINTVAPERAAGKIRSI
jgi:UDPglucose--hexose-1-phosphate uridylyltransferase